MVLRVLVTRPGDDGIALSKLLEAKGIQTIIEPLLTKKYFKGPEIDLLNFQALVLTSANGVRALAKRTSRRDIRLYAVGDATATTAREAGFGEVYSAAGNIESLADLIAEKSSSADGPFLHIAGSSVAGDLKNLINTAGFVCEREILYEAIAERSLRSSTIGAMKDKQVNVITLYSPRSAERFVDLVRKARLVRVCQEIRVVCLSEAVASNVREIQWKDVLIAEEPNQESLLAIIDRLTNSKLDKETLGESDDMKNNNRISKKDDQSRHDVPMDVNRNSGTLRTVIITLLAVVVILGAGLASKSLWDAELEFFGRIFSSKSQTNNRANDFQGRLEALEKSQQALELDQLQREKPHLQKKLDRTLERVAGLEKSIDTMREIIDDVKGSITAEATNSSQELFARLLKLENESKNFRKLYQSQTGKTIEMLSEELVELEKKIPRFSTGTENKNSQSIVFAISQLRETIRAGKPFSTELMSVKAVNKSNQNTDVLLSEMLGKIESYSKAGIFNLAKLQADFMKRASKIVQAGLIPSEGSWFQKTLAR